MRIEVKGRNVAATDELREHAARRFARIDRQVAELAELRLEVWEERNSASAERCAAEATLQLKGVTLRASAVSPDLARSVTLVADELAVQVKRHRDKRRGRRTARASAPPPAPA